MTKFIAVVSRGADYLNAVAFVVMSLGVIIAVFARYFFRCPISEAMELAYFSMLWSAFLQTGNALLQNKHVSMDLIKDRLTGKARVVFEIGIQLVILMTVIPLVGWSISLTWESYLLGWRDPGVLEMPICLLYLIIVLGSLFLGIISCAKLVETAKKLMEE